MPSLFQGQSAATELKERGLQSAFTINLRVFSKFKYRYTYWHFDLNSGSGINDDFGCIGSPLAFISAAHKTETPRYFAGFCDLNAAALGQLSSREGVVENDQCFLFHGDNSSLITAIPDIIATRENPKFAIGTVLSDPNGSQVPLDHLERLALACPKIDFVVNWNSRVFKLFQGKKWADRPTLNSAIQQMNKKHWLIRQPLGAHKWTLLVGRNYRIGGHPSLGFYNLDTPKGTEVFNRCNFLDRDNPDIARQAFFQPELEF